MSWFTRLTKVGNPYHDASGEFTSASGVGGGAGQRPALPNGRHNGENAFAGTMNMLQSSVPAETFRSKYAVFAKAVHDVVRDNPGANSTEKAKLIWNKLKDSGDVQVRDAIQFWRAPETGNRPFSRIKDTLSMHEAPVGLAAEPRPVTHTAPAGVSSPVFPRAPARTPAQLASDALPPLSSRAPAAAINATQAAARANPPGANRTAQTTPGYSQMPGETATAFGRRLSGGVTNAAATAASAAAARLAGGTPVRMPGEALGAYQSRVNAYEIGRLTPSARSASVSGPSATGSAARAMSSPQAAAATAPPAAPKVKAADMNAAGFRVGQFGQADLEKTWGKVFGEMKPQEVMDTMWKAIRTSPADKVSLTSEGNALLMSLDNSNARITRQFKADSSGRIIVDHSFFKVNEWSARGHGLGKQFIGDSMELYKKIGAVKVTVHANIDVGGYAWAKYAFTPNNDSWPALSSDLSRRVSNVATDTEFTQGKKEALLRLLKNPDPRSAWDFADSAITKGGEPVAKKAMLNSDWNGTLDMKNPVTMERFNAYVQRSRN